MSKVCIVGAGLAGSELAYQLSRNNVQVTLYEPRLNGKYDDGVHKTMELAELVCSNSLRSNELHNAVGLLKEELRRLGSLLIRTADECSVPAGNALAVSREDFCRTITKKISSDTNINLIAEEVNDLNELTERHDHVVIAAGPVASRALCEQLKTIIGKEYLYFYDAIAPLVDVSTINMDVCFRASRYESTEQGKGDYINAPMDKDQYYSFVDALKNARKIPVQHGDESIFFRGCMPVEVMAEDSPDHLLNGPMRGDGLIDPHTGKAPYAAIQLRQDNAAGTIYNMVGFQTRLVYGEQERIFRSIPGLAKAVFLRFGSMHKNIYLNAPQLLRDDMSLIINPKVFVAGQISGVEGYVESIAHAVFVSRILVSRIHNTEYIPLPDNTAIGSLCSYILRTDKKGFQPMKMNFGLFPPLSDDDKKVFLSKGPRSFQSKLAMSKRSLSFFEKLN